MKEKVRAHTWGEVLGAAVGLQALSAGQVSSVASHLLEVAQELNEADHAVTVRVGLLHLCAQSLGCLLVLHQPTLLN